MATQIEKAPWQAAGSEKREAVRDLFSGIADRYDLLNSIMSLSRHRRWREHAVSTLELKRGDSALDVCSGTGDFLVPLRKAVGSDGRVLGVDFCLPMLRRAREKSAPGFLMQGDASALPVQSDSVDAVTVGWGIRNVQDIDKAHHEIVRVLKTGGRFVSLDMALPRNNVTRAVSGVICGRLLPLLGSLFGAKKAYIYLPKSTQSFASREQLAESMKHAGFVEIGWKDLMFGNICMHWGRKP